jgi:hypothetical protein
VRNRHNPTGPGKSPKSSRLSRWAPYLLGRPRPTPPPPPLAGIPHPLHIGSFRPQQISHIANSALYSSSGITQASQSAQEFLQPISYQIGQHGNKLKEQDFLTDKSGFRVNGDNFQSEHSIGYEAIARPLPEKRGTAGLPSRIENTAPAYQEVRSAHEGHIGTGGKGSPRDRARPDRTDLPDKFSDEKKKPEKGSELEKFFKENPDRLIPNPKHWGPTRHQYGYRTDRYRDDQRAAIMDDRASDAVQLNQLGYARDQRHRDARGTIVGGIADTSFQRHVEHMGAVPYPEDSNTVRYTSPPTAHQRAEMFLSREIANTGRQPTPARRAEVLSYFFDLDNGLTPTSPLRIPPGQPHLPYTDDD